MTKSAEQSKDVQRLKRRVEKTMGHTFVLPPQWGAKTAIAKLRLMLKYTDPRCCPVCGNRHAHK